MFGETNDDFIKISKPPFLLSTPPKTNMEPKNGGLEDDFPFQIGDFLVPC